MQSSRKSAARASLAGLCASSMTSLMGPATIAVRPTARTDIIIVQTDARGGSGDSRSLRPRLRVCPSAFRDKTRVLYDIMVVGMIAVMAIGIAAPTAHAAGLH